MDAKAVADGDTITVYVSITDPRESSCVPPNVHAAAGHRSKARAQRNYAEADAFHKQIIDSGYRLVRSFPTPNVSVLLVSISKCFTFYCFFLSRVIPVQNDEVLAKKYRIRLR